MDFFSNYARNRLCEDKVGRREGTLRDTFTLGTFFKVGGTRGCLCCELWLLIGANVMNAGRCVETDALCHVADFSGRASLSIAGTSRRGEHLAGRKIMREKGEAREEEEM